MELTTQHDHSFADEHAGGRATSLSLPHRIAPLIPLASSPLRSITFSHPHCFKIDSYFSWSILVQI